MEENQMSRNDRIRKTALFAIIFVAWIFLGWQGLGAQTGSPLLIRDVQLLNTSGNRICQHIFENGQYKLAWQSADLGGTPSVRLGDIDNDGQKGVVASIYFMTRSVKTKARITEYYNFNIMVFENGAPFDGKASWETGPLGELEGTLINDSWIADVDNDSAVKEVPDNELVLIRSRRLEVYHFDGSTGAYAREIVKETDAYRYLFSLEVGDADGLGDNEIVIPYGGRPIIYKHEGSGWSETCAEPVPAMYYAADATSVSFTYLRIRDADNEPGNEIIAAGSNRRLLVWKWQGGAYKFVAASQELGGNATYGLDCGDIDGDNHNEVVIDVWATKKLPAKIVVLGYDAGLYVLKNTFDSGYADQRDLRLGDLDGDLRAEVVVNTAGTPPGPKVLRFIGALAEGHFEQVYAPAISYFSYISKIEIR
jgi:hypothetical protein